MQIRHLLISILTALALMLGGPLSMDLPAASATPTRPAPTGPVDRFGFAAMDTTGLELIETPHFKVWATPDAVPGFRKILDRAEGYRERIQADLGSDDEAPIRVVVIEDLNDYFVRRDRPRGAPPWAVGLAVSGEDTILVKWGRSDGGPWVDMDKTFVHELAHIALDRKVGEFADHAHAPDRVAMEAPRGRRVPRWFHEGFAIASAGEWTLERSTVLMEAGIGGHIISLHDLREGFPAEGFGVELAYAESFNFLQYLDGRFGRDKRIRMLDRMAEGETFEDAFFGAYKVEFGRVEQDWYERMNVAYTWVPIAFGSTTLWFLGGLVFVAAWMRRRRETRARMEALDDDLPAETAPPLPLPGLGLTDAHVRGSGVRVFGDGSWLAADGEAASRIAPSEEPLTASGEWDEVHVEEDEVPRTPEGYTLH